MKLKAKSYLFDTHAHVNFNAFKDDADEVLKKSLVEGVFVVNVGSQFSTSKRAVEMAHKYDGVYAAVGLHPVQLKAGTIEYQDDYELDKTEIITTGESFDWEKYLELAKDEKVVAIGEVGLDYHHFETGDDIEAMKTKQKEVLIKFIGLANEVRKPVMLHCWDGYADLLEILQKYPVAKKGIVHSFIGSYKTAVQFIELGYKIGLNGIITYSESYDKLIRETPLEDIVLETDCPYLTPVPHKGERNVPAYVKLVAAKIASVKNITADEVAKATTQSAKSILNIL
jgi:TatD DNase family protein